MAATRGEEHDTEAAETRRVQHDISGGLWQNQYLVGNTSEELDRR